MIPWEKLGSARTPDGRELSLHRRAGELVVRAGAAVLMSSRAHHSEDQLAVLGCAHCRAVPDARVLVGGLGMGFTLRAALDVLGPGARVEVAELLREVVEWNRGPLAPLARAPLSDLRVAVRVGDVRLALDAAPGAWDAVLLDVDNGPTALSAAGNQGLYGEAGLRRVARALRSRGALALWSAGDDLAFTARLKRAGFAVRQERVQARRGKGSTHVLWLATLEPAASGARRE